MSGAESKNHRKVKLERPTRPSSPTPCSMQEYNQSRSARRLSKFFLNASSVGGVNGRMTTEEELKERHGMLSITWQRKTGDWGKEVELRRMWLTGYNAEWEQFC